MNRNGCIVLCNSDYIGWRRGLVITVSIHPVRLKSPLDPEGSVTLNFEGSVTADLVGSVTRHFEGSVTINFEGSVILNFEGSGTADPEGLVPLKVEGSGTADPERSVTRHRNPQNAHKTDCGNPTAKPCRQNSGSSTTQAAWVSSHFLRFRTSSPFLPLPSFLSASCCLFLAFSRFLFS